MEKLVEQLKNTEIGAKEDLFPAENKKRFFLAISRGIEKLEKKIKDSGSFIYPGSIAELEHLDLKRLTELKDLNSKLFNPDSENYLRLSDVYSESNKQLMKILEISFIGEEF